MSIKSVKSDEIVATWIEDFPGANGKRVLMVAAGTRPMFVVPEDKVVKMRDIINAALLDIGIGPEAAFTVKVSDRPN